MHSQKVLDALKGYKKFRETGPHDPSRDEHDPDILTIACNDAGVNMAVILQRMGKVFPVKTISGGMVPSSEQESGFTASLSFPLFNKNIHTIMVVGHTQCAGVAALVDAVINNKSPDESDTLAWMLSLGTDEVRDMILEDHGKGIGQKLIAAKVERMMPLLSCTRLLEYTFRHGGQSYTMKDLLKEKSITLIPALYRVERNQKDPNAGKLYLYDNTNHRYEALDTILEKNSQKPSPQVQAKLSLGEILREDGLVLLNKL